MKKPTGADGKVTILIENIYFSFFEAPLSALRRGGLLLLVGLKVRFRTKMVSVIW